MSGMDPGKARFNSLQAGVQVEEVIPRHSIHFQSAKLQRSCSVTTQWYCMLALCSSQRPCVVYIAFCYLDSVNQAKVSSSLQCILPWGVSRGVGTEHGPFGRVLVVSLLYLSSVLCL